MLVEQLLPARTGSKLLGARRTRLFCARLFGREILFGLGNFFGMGDERGEARVSMQRIEVRVFRHPQIPIGFEPVIDGLSQERKCLRLVPLVGRDAAQIVSGHRRLRMFRSQDPLFAMQRFEVYLLCLAVMTFFHQRIAERRHGV